MCGIAGIIGEGNYDSMLSEMLKLQHHRGPDYTGIKHFPGFAHLGHNRLSIIDLSEHANQPFESNDERYSLIFNGEIYNYTEIKESLKHKYSFKTKSDTEVLLASYIVYGPSCLELFRGMFSFAIWDNQEKSLFCARDRFGVKPFNYLLTSNTFAFSSEIKALLSTGIIEKKWNLPVWSTYMTNASYGMPDETFWQDIQQLPGGHYAIYKDKNLKIHKYYNFEQNVSALKIPENIDEAEIELEALLKENIKYRLRSDVKVGFNLSGGVDSTLLFQLIRNELDKKNTNAFTFYSNDKKYDEIEWVKEIIGDSGFEWTKTLITSEEIPSFAEKIQFHQDEPFAGIATLAYAKTFQKARESGCIVLLDGSGIDEQFVGYDYYTNNNNLNVQGTSTSPVRKNCLSFEFQGLAKKIEYPKPFNDSIRNLQYRDIFYTKMQRDMRFNDRISMAFSTELREPFLDHKLFEFAFSMPEEFKIKDGIRKKIIREIVRKNNGGSIAEAPKRPIQTPQREWLSGPLKSWVNDMVELALTKHNFMIKKEVRKELQMFFNGNNENSFYIWQWITLAIIN